MVKAVIVGNGAREHAIAKALVRGGATLKAFMKSNNPGELRARIERAKKGVFDDDADDDDDDD